jgi:hypothetical protein
MGSGRFDYATYRAFSSSTVGKSTGDIYKSRSINKALDPLGVTVRESRDSADNPKSTPVIVALDVTGSMGMLADTIARQGLGTLFKAILDRKPISDPHVMFMAVGDAYCDSAPLQVSQFEADVRIIEQLTQIYIEGGGGGNDTESYELPWYFAAQHTVHDSIEKRGKRGYLFTVGDEMAPRGLTASEIERFIGDKLQGNNALLQPRSLLDTVSQFYDVFHIIIEEGNFASRHLPAVVDSWRGLLGQRVVQLPDHTKLAETIVSIIEVNEGIDAKKSAESWSDASTKSIVHKAVRLLGT